MSKTLTQFRAAIGYPQEDNNGNDRQNRKEKRQEKRGMKMQLPGGFPGMPF